jgi:Fibronectin type III domain.
VNPHYIRDEYLTDEEQREADKHIGKGLRWFFLYALLMFLLLVLGTWYFGLPEARAATTFASSVTAADGELATTLTWESTLPSCTASGHPDWDGPVSSSGTKTLPTITLSGTYTLTLTCTSPEDRSARLTWQLPTQNTDGTPYTNHALTRIHYGRSATNLNQTAEVAGNATTHTVENLDLGTWYFAVSAVNTNGTASALSNVASKTMRAGSSESESVTLTVNPIPAPAVLTSVE